MSDSEALVGYLLVVEETFEVLLDGRVGALPSILSSLSLSDSSPSSLSSSSFDSSSESSFIKAFRILLSLRTLVFEYLKRKTKMKTNGNVRRFARDPIAASS